MPEKRLLIGSADDADIVIMKPTVSRNHCELRFDGSNWEVRDLGSTNGTFVNDVRIAKPTRVNGTERLMLGREQSINLAEVIRTYGSSASPGEPRHDQNADRRRPLLALALSALVIVVVGTVIFAVSGRGKPGGELVSQPVEAVADSASRAEQSHSTPPDASPVAQPANVPPQVISSPYWAIVLENGSGTTRKLVGTCVAIAPQRVAMLASIAEAMVELRSEYPKLLMTQDGKNFQHISFDSLRVHPDHSSGLRELVQFEEELKKKVEAIDSAAEPSLDESLDWSSRFEKVRSQILNSEMAIGQCERPVATFLSLRAGSLDGPLKCVLSGYPMLTPSPDLPTDLPSLLLKGNAIVEAQTVGTTRLLLAKSQDFFGIPLISLAVVDSDGRLIGLVSQQDPQQMESAIPSACVTQLIDFWTNQ